MDEEIVKRVQFRLLSTEDVLRMSVVKVTNASALITSDNGINDLRMGTTINTRTNLCPTCKNIDCSGHMGHIELAKPVWRFPYLRITLGILRSVCCFCGRSKWTPQENERLCRNLAMIAEPDKRLRHIADLYKTRSYCCWSESVIEEAIQNGCILEDTTPCGRALPTFRVNKQIFIERVWDPKKLQKFTEEEQRLLTQPYMPQETQALFNIFSPSLCQTLGFNSRVCHPKNLIADVIVVPPPALRPSLKGGERTFIFENIVWYIIYVSQVIRVRGRTT
jgi:DNA-directed RNA polymerase II subunit RPB1